MKKRFFIIAVMIILSLGIIACGKSEEKSSKKSKKETTSESDEKKDKKEKDKKKKDESEDIEDDVNEDQADMYEGEDETPAQEEPSAQEETPETDGYVPQIEHYEDENIAFDIDRSKFKTFWEDEDGCTYKYEFINPEGVKSGAEIYIHIYHYEEGFDGDLNGQMEIDNPHGDYPVSEITVNGRDAYKIENITYEEDNSLSFVYVSLCVPLDDKGINSKKFAHIYYTVNYFRYRELAPIADEAINHIINSLEFKY